MNRDSRFPPVTLDTRREPFGAPQYQSSGPNNLPRKRGRLSFEQRGGLVWVRSDHCYADTIDLSFDVSETASAKIIDEPPGLRNMLLMRNASPGTQIIYVSFGKDATARSTVAIVAGQMAMWDFVVPQEDIYAISSAAGGILSVMYSIIPEV